uniref:carbonic anhydrase 4a isoform X2 n=1 Tax=Pristiophorus japonicus TaxID=55135 RepID=UPI00398F0AFC
MHSLIPLLASLCLPFLCLGDGPSHWKDHFPSCGWMEQSPINIVTKNAQIDTKLIPIEFEGYDDPDTDANWTITNNGHSVQVGLKGDIAIKGGNLPNKYKAVQFHYHWGTKSEFGSEHAIDGEKYPVEMHIVHMNEQYSSIADAVKDPDGLAVLGFMFVESPEENLKSKALINVLKTVPNQGKEYLAPFSLKDLIPDEEKLKKYYRYRGSLTTPGCEEAVIWTVFEEPIPLSKSQLSTFYETFFSSDSKPITLNFRPIQKRNGRKVYVSDSAVRPFDAAVLSSVLTVWTSILFN